MLSMYPGKKTIFYFFSKSRFFPTPLPRDGNVVQRAVLKLILNGIQNGTSSLISALVHNRILRSGIKPKFF